jgi:transketolase
MDLTALEQKLNSLSQKPFSPQSNPMIVNANTTISNPFINTSHTTATRATATRATATRATTAKNPPVSVTRKINEITDEEIQNYSEKMIPSWNNLQSLYEGQWNKEKEKFQTHLKGNFSALVERFASGKQELFQLCAPERREKLYIEAFLELFESGYAPHVGDVERIANKRVRKLFITLPNNYSSIY